MADIQYLNYGDLQIELLALMNNLANNVLQYVQTQPWSKKRKELFMSAYLDLMNKGVQGASNSTGLWTINVKGDLDLSTKSKKEQEMYQEAAYFIQQLMAGLPTKANQEEEKTKDLPVFDYSTFNKGFLTQMSNDYFGGNPALKTSIWNEFDKRNTETGLRDRTERAKKLISSLEKYAKTLKDSDYNFKDSPFGSLEELNNRIAKARTALIDTPTNTDDDLEALSALGINASDWFNNGSGDPYKTEGYEGTYGDYYGRILPQLEKDKAKAEVEKLKASQQAAYNNTLFITRGSSKLQGRSPQELKLKYGADDKLRQALFQYSQLNIRNLTPDEQSELHGAYRYLAKSPIDNKLLKRLLSSSSGLYKNASLNRFKKINGIDNLIWDSAAGLVIQILDRGQYNSTIQNLDLFAGVLTLLDKENKYFRNANDGFTDADRRELEAIALDLTAMFDPTRIYGTAAGVGASGLRTYNRWTDADGFTLSDLGASVLDLGLNGVQWLPGVGNVANGAKGILSLAKFAPRIGKLIARAGAAGGLIYGISGLPEVWNKIDFAHPIDSAKRLTVEDWRKLSALIAGIKGTRDLNVTNRATRKVLEQNDIQVSNRLSDKVGLTRTKIESEVSTPTVRMKVGDKEVSIPIDEKIKLNLSKKLNKKGNSSEERSKVARENIELLKAAEKAGIKIKDKDGKLTKEWEEAVITYEPSWRDKTFFGRQIPGVAKNTGTFGTSTSSASNIGNSLKFLEYLNKRGSLDKAWYGSNTTLRRINDNLLKNGIYGKEAISMELLSEISHPQELSQKALPFHTNKKVDLERIRKYLENFKKGKGADSSEDLNFNIDETTGSVNLGKGNSINYFKQDNGKYRAVWVIKGKQYSENFNSLKELKERMAKLANDISLGLYGKINHKEVAQALRNMEAFKLIKASKQGGTIDKQKIQKYKEFIKK